MFPGIALATVRATVPASSRLSSGQYGHARLTNRARNRHPHRDVDHHHRQAAQATDELGRLRRKRFGLRNAKHAVQRVRDHGVTCSSS